MSKHVAGFISKLVVHFGEPKFDVADADKGWAHREWLREMVQNLGTFEADVLDKAASSIAATRKHRNFPLISECKSACLDARKWLESQRPKLPMRDHHKMPEAAPEREQLAKELICGEMGRRACGEDWIWGLYQFCLRNARLPSDFEAAKLRSAAVSANEIIEQAARGDLGSMSRTIVIFGRTLHARRDEMKSFVLDGVVT